MGLFKRRESQAASPASAKDAEYVGRRFESSAPIEACLSTYETILPTLFPVAASESGIVWTEPVIPAGWESTQFKSPMTRPPDRVLGHRLRTGGVIYLAVWEATVGGRHQLWFVPPGFDFTVPSPIGGTWFSALKSAGHPPVVSDGFVERTMWGVQA